MHLTHETTPLQGSLQKWRRGMRKKLQNWLPIGSQMDKVKLEEHQNYPPNRQMMAWNSHELIVWRPKPQTLSYRRFTD